MTLVRIEVRLRKPSCPARIVCKDQSNVMGLCKSYSDTRGGSNMRLQLLACLMTLALFPSADGAINPELLKWELRSHATEVVEIAVQRVDVREGPEANQVIVVARVIKVVSSPTRLSEHQVIDICYTQDHGRVSRELAEQDRKAEEGWAGRQIIGHARTLRKGETVRAYLATSSVGSTYYPAAAEFSFERITAGTSADPCATIEEVGAIGDLVHLCVQQRYQDAQRQLDHVVDEFTQIVAPLPAEDYSNASSRDADVNRERHFRLSQQAWEDYRNNACQEVYYEYWPGSIGATAQIECMLELTKSRTEYLQRRNSDQEHTRADPRGR